MIEGINIRWTDASIRGIFCDYDAFSMEIQDNKNCNYAFKTMRCLGFLGRVSKIGSASSQILPLEAGFLASFCHEEAAEAFDRQAMEADGAVAFQAEATAP